MPHDTRDSLVDFVRSWSGKTDIPVARFLAWLGIGASKYHDWKQRFGKVNEHNAWVPRDHWLTPDEKQRISAFARQNPSEGYRRLTFMMLDANLVACSPASVYRVLKAAGLLAGATPHVTKKGTGFVQPLAPHEHWHVDVNYLNVAGAFHFLCSVLDGCSRFIVHHEIREKMEESDVETILQRARERHPGAAPRIISDNDPQFIAKDFKEFIRVTGMTHVKTSPYYPQSNGKIERWHKTLKGDSIRVKVPLSLDDARNLVGEYATHCNQVRLHSAIGYVTPQDKLEGRDKAIFDERDRKLAEARERRKLLRQAERDATPSQPTAAEPAAPAAPLIDFAAVRAAITIAAVLQLLGATTTPAKAPSTAGRSPCTARPPARAAASSRISRSTRSTASSAAAAATPWTCGRRRPANRSTTRRSTCASAWASRRRPSRRPGTGKRNPSLPRRQPLRWSQPDPAPHPLSLTRPELSSKSG